MANVLIVEDEVVIAEVIKEFLAQQGITSYICVNGRQAMEWLDKNQPGLILSDVMMPIMNGVTLLDNVKNNPQTKTIPFLFMSSGNLGEKDPRINGFVKKPFDLESMGKIVKTALSP